MKLSNTFMSKATFVSVTFFILGGCSLAPEYQQPEAPIPQQWEANDSEIDEQLGVSETPAAATLGWREYFLDPVLQDLISLALENNRELRIAALNVEAYQAQYRIQRAELFPSVNGGAGGTRQRIPADLSLSGREQISSQYSATVGIPAWELDFFGRLDNLSEQALQTYFANLEVQRSAQVSLVASVAQAWFTLLADHTLLNLTQDTLENYQHNFDITQQSFDAGNASALELSQARTSLDSTKVSLAAYQRRVDSDRNALALLIGRPLPHDVISDAQIESNLLAEIPPGLPSQLLQRRPDILQAEHMLRAANANIGAARAALFPSVALTANAGTASSELSGLFESGSGSWMISPSLSLPIFNNGALRARVDVAEIQQKIRVARYENAIQVAFQEVVDGLVARETYGRQLDSQQELLKSTQHYYDLAERRYRSGVDSYLTLLDAQRQLFAVRQSRIGDRLSQLVSEVNLYKALGGGWQEQAMDAVKSNSSSTSCDEGSQDYNIDCEIPQADRQSTTVSG